MYTYVYVYVYIFFLMMFSQNNKWLREDLNREVAFRCDIPKKICRMTS
jgi:hypothetical protein